MGYSLRMKTGRIARLSERLGRYDDTHTIYRADDPEQQFAWGQAGKIWIVTKVVYVALLIVLSAVVGPPVALGLLGGLTLIELVWYCIWRRRRNRRLAGSPWTRPPHERPPDPPTP
jgi:hypothetical protein